MKKLFFIMMLFISINASCQYELYSCRKAAVSETNVTNWNSVETSFLVRIDVDKSIIEFNNHNELRIYLNNQSVNKKMIDEEGDEYLYTVYTAYDNEGRKCEFRSYDYLYLLNRNFIIVYDDYKFFYMCKILNLKQNEESTSILQ